ncbi:MAG: PAS domain S-box protein [Desulfobulbus sp.]
MNPILIWLVILFYFGFLFYIAFLAEKETPLSRRITRSPLVYTLSLAVYCTSWTFYGSVGKAANSGLTYLGVYLGPTIMIALWWILLRRMVLLKDRYRITSIADFISARYGKSELIAGVVTLIALVGNMPYIALQFKAIKSSFNILAASESSSGMWIMEHFGTCIVLIMTFFTILFGARKLDPTERHRGMITAIAFQSVIKLAAFLACGIYVTYFLADGFQDIFSPAFLENPTAAAVLRLGEGEHVYITWATILLLSMSAIILLPRQFHVAVVENAAPRNILTAMWLFPLYMVIINIFVVPIALFGIHSGMPLQQADTYVLNIPIANGNILMALLVFIGGFSAAASMIMISSMTMSTMIVNHLLLPLFEILPALASSRRYLLYWRWVSIIVIISVGLWTEAKLGESYALVNMGLISFAAAIQFAPVVIGALFWSKGCKAGALSGLIAGFSVWFYTLLLPAFVRSGWWFDRSILDAGPWGIGFLRPEQLFGLNALPALSHSVFWSLLFNLSFFVLISCLAEQDKDEQDIAQDFHATTAKNTLSGHHFPVEDTIDITKKYAAYLEVLNEYFPEEKSRKVLDQTLGNFSLLDRKTVSIIDFAEYHQSIVNTLAGSIGSAMAHRALNRDSIFSRREKLSLGKAYADLLSRLNVSPLELAEKINFYKEREDLLTSHSKELEKRIREKECEIEARKQAEQALKAAELQYRSIFDNALEGIFQTSADGDFLTVNPAMATILGYESPATLIVATPNIRTHLKPDQTRCETFFHQLHVGEQVKNFEIQAMHSCGKILWLNLNAKSIMNDQGQLEKIEGIAEDITKRREAEEKLAQHQANLEEKVRLRTTEVRENQAFLQEVLEGIHAAVIVIHQDTKAILDCNSIMESLLGYDKETLVADDGPLKTDNTLFSELREKSLNQEFVVKRQNGSMIPVLRNVLPVVFKGTLAYAVIFFDISERKALEQQVNMAQKLQAIGQLAAGIAHEINTPIQYIGGNITFLSDSFNQLLEVHKQYSELMERAKRGDELTEFIEDISSKIEALDLDYLLEEIPLAVKQSLSGVDQVASIVLAMKQFAHPEQENLAAVDVNKALEQTAAVSKNEWKYVADLKMDLDPTDPVITGYPGPLNQVFLNIIVNAAHAIAEKVGDGGAKGQIVIRTKANVDSVIISIADTGCGIPADKIQKIYDPFFTTKVVGKGTGQGLNIAYTIITEKHKGTISVESEVGKGTTFNLILPFSETNDGSDH